MIVSNRKYWTDYFHFFEKCIYSYFFSFFIITFHLENLYLITSTRVILIKKKNKTKLLSKNRCNINVKTNS